MAEQPDSESPELLRPAPIERIKPYLIILPALLLTIGILVPFGTGVFWSFTDYNLMRPNFQFTGLRNYARMFQSESFWNAIRVSATYVVLAVGAELIIGLIIGLLLNRDNPVTRILRRCSFCRCLSHRLSRC